MAVARSASIEAVTAARLLVLRPAVVPRAGEREARVARALPEEISERVVCFITGIAGQPVSRLSAGA